MVRTNLPSDATRVSEGPIAVPSPSLVQDLGTTTLVRASLSGNTNQMSEDITKATALVVVLKLREVAGAELLVKL